MYCSYIPAPDPAPGRAECRDRKGVVKELERNKTLSPTTFGKYTTTAPRGRLWVLVGDKMAMHVTVVQMPYLDPG